MIPRKSLLVSATTSAMLMAACAAQPVTVTATVGASAAPSDTSGAMAPGTTVSVAATPGTSSAGAAMVDLGQSGQNGGNDVCSALLANAGLKDIINIKSDQSKSAQIKAWVNSDDFGKYLLELAKSHSTGSDAQSSANGSSSNSSSESSSSSSASGQSSSSSKSIGGGGFGYSAHASVSAANASYSASTNAQASNSSASNAYGTMMVQVQHDDGSSQTETLDEFRKQYNSDQESSSSESQAEETYQAITNGLVVQAWEDCIHTTKGAQTGLHIDGKVVGNQVVLTVSYTPAGDSSTDPNPIIQSITAVGAKEVGSVFASGAKVPIGGITDAFDITGTAVSLIVQTDKGKVEKDFGSPTQNVSPPTPPPAPASSVSAAPVVLDSPRPSPSPLTASSPTPTVILSPAPYSASFPVDVHNSTFMMGIMPVKAGDHLLLVGSGQYSVCPNGCWVSSGPKGDGANGVPILLGPDGLLNISPASFPAGLGLTPRASTHDGDVSAVVPAPDLPCFALVGRVGDEHGSGERFLIGSRVDYVVPASGGLYVSLNDWGAADNNGSMNVRLTVFVPAGGSPPGGFVAGY